MIHWNEIEDLGKVADSELAYRLGVSSQCVYQARKRRNIPAKNPTPTYKIDWNSVPLGKMTDEHLAELLGCTAALVHKKRHQKQIPAFGMLYRTVENEAAYYGEAIIDAWLHNKSIIHSFQFQIGPYRVDWMIHKTKEIWEFVGMWDHRLYGKTYREKFAVKEAYLKDQGYDVRKIHQTELSDFKKEVDLQIIHKAVAFKCNGCNRDNVKHHGHGLCSTCVGRKKTGRSLGPIKISFLKPTDNFECEDCRSKNRCKRVQNKCHKCYSKLFGGDS